MSFFFQAEDGIRDLTVTGVQTCALPIYVPRAGCGEPCFAIWKNSSWPSAPTSTVTTRIPRTSSEQPAPPISRKRLPLLVERYRNVILNDALHWYAGHAERLLDRRGNSHRRKAHH